MAARGGVLPSISHSGLRHLITKRVSESTGHLERLEQFFDLHHTSPAEGISKVIDLIIFDSDENIPHLDDPARSDFILLIQVLRVEQYEIAYYEIVVKVAEQLGYIGEAEMLTEFLAERDNSADILRKLQSEMIRNAFPTEIRPEPPFQD